MLALPQPVAIDLRRIIDALKMNTDLERMSDLSGKIAERAISIAELPPIAVPDKLQIMTDLTISMVRQSLDAFVMLNAEQARQVIRLDDEVDRYNREIIAELIHYMQQTPEQVPAFMAFFSAVRQLERIADHATNISEDIIFWVRGHDVRHGRDLLVANNPGEDGGSTTVSSVTENSYGLHPDSAVELQD